MPGPLVAGIAGSVASAGLQASAAKKAGKAQSKAADAQIEETRRQFDLMQSLLKPYVTAGNAGLKAQLDLMGIGGGDITPAVEVIGDSYFVNGQEFATANEARAFAETNRTPGVGAQQAQRNAIGALENGAQFGALIKQGEYGLMANQAATGGLRGGDTARAMGEFRPAMLQALIDKQLAQYGGLAANGQSAAAMTGVAAQNTAGMVNQALDARGQAQAGAALGVGTAWSNAGSGILNVLGQIGGKTDPNGGAWAKWQF